jgi:hypothetical protein
VRVEVLVVTDSLGELDVLPMLVVSGLQVTPIRDVLHVEVRRIDDDVVVLASTTWVESDPVGVDVVVVVVVLVPARPLTGLSSSATNPARRTVAATAPRRAALIGGTAAGWV